MIQMFLDLVKTLLLNGEKVGTKKGYIQIVQTTNFTVPPHRMNIVSRSKKNIGEIALGPLHKKVFIQAFFGDLTKLKKVRANKQMAKLMYEATVSGKQFKNFDNEICTY